MNYQQSTNHFLVLFQFIDEEGLIYKPLDFEIFDNISSFGVFEVSRLAVFEKFLRRTSYLQLQLQTLTDVGTNVVTPPEIDALSKIPQQNVHDVSKVLR